MIIKLMLMRYMRLKFDSSPVIIGFQEITREIMCTQPYELGSDSFCLLSPYRLSLLSCFEHQILSARRCPLNYSITTEVYDLLAAATD